VQASTNYELVIRAMAVAAAVVRDDGVGAVLAAPDVAAERHRAAGLIALITFSWSPTTWAVQKVGSYLG